MTFWLGNAFLFGGATAYAPEDCSAVDHLPSWANRAIGLGALFAIVCYLLWLAPAAGAPSAAPAGGWHCRAFDFTLVQIAIGALDLTLITLAMYTVLPPTRRSGSSR